MKSILKHTEETVKSHGETYVKPTDADRKLWLEMSRDAKAKGFTALAEELRDAATKPKRFLLREDRLMLYRKHFNPVAFPKANSSNPTS